MSGWQAAYVVSTLKSARVLAFSSSSSSTVDVAKNGCERSVRTTSLRTAFAM